MQTKTKIKSTSGFPDQRVKENEKKSEEWYIACTNYIIDRATSEKNLTETIENLKLANGIVNHESIGYVLKAYGKHVQDKAKETKFPAHIREIDIITPIRERYLGEYIKQYHNYQVYIHDSDSVFMRNQELAKAVQVKLFNKFNELLETQDEAALEGLDLEKFAAEFVEEWVDERVIKGQRRLNLINDLTSASVKYIQGFFYWWATDECYSYRDVRYNELHKEIVSPLEYYRVDSGNIFVEDDDMGMRRYKMSINQIIDNFRNDISEEDLIYLKNLLNKYSTNDGISIPVGILKNRKSFEMYDFANSASGNNLDVTDASRLMDVYHCVWKTETLIKKLKYVDFNTGEVKEIEVSQDYKLDEAEGDISIEKDWINETYESYRFGGKFEGVYLPAKPIKVQRQEVNNSSVCKLPYNGISGILANVVKNPIPKRLSPYQLLLRLYHHQREKAIAKFKTFNLMPESILLDSDEMTMDERFAYATIDDILPFNDSELEPSVLQAIKSLYNQGAERYISILSEVIESLKRDAMDIANMNEQRYGDIGQQAGKSVTEYAITKATTGSILMFEMYNKFREREYMADLDWSKAAWIDGKQGSYIDPQTKEVTYIDIDGVADLGTNYGVFIKNSALEEEKLKMYRELAFSASQGGNYSVAADAIHSENSTEIRRLIKKEEEARKEYERSIQQSQNELQQQLAQSQEQIKMQEQQHEKEITFMKEEAATNRKIAELEVKMQEISMKFSEVPDAGITDEQKRNLEDAKMELAREKQELERMKYYRDQGAKPE